LSGFEFATVNGATHAGGAVAAQAQADVGVAYDDLASRPPTETGISELAGRNLVSGVYNGNVLFLTGTLTLDGQGNPDAVFIFQSASILVVGADASVELINDAQACNVFWQIGEDATIGTRANFVGNILALQSITLMTAAENQGSLYVRNGAINLDTNTITTASCTAPPLNPILTLSKTPSSTTFVVGQSATFTLLVGNSGNAPTNGTITITDPLPPGLTYVPGSGTGATFSSDGQTITTENVIEPQATAAPISFQVLVDSAALPSVTNVAEVSGGGAMNIEPSTATVTVIPAISAPLLTLSKMHTPTPFTAGDEGLYNLEVGNAGTASTNGLITLIDTLPSGVTLVEASGEGWDFQIAGQTIIATTSTSIIVGNQAPPISLRVQVNPDAGPSLTNVANVSGGGAINTGLAIDTVTVSSTISSPLLTLSKTHTPASFVGGEEGLYALGVGNAGSAPTSGLITLVDTLPSGVTLIEASGEGWAFQVAGQTVIATTSTSIAAGGRAPSISLRVEVGPSAGPSVTNIADVSGGRAINIGRAIDTVVVTPSISSPLLTLSSTPAPAPFIGGKQGVYTLRVGNAGSAPTSGPITLVDTLPSGLTFINVRGKGWTFQVTGQTIIATTNRSIAAREQASPIFLRVQVSPSAGPSVTNVADVSGGGAINIGRAIDTVAVIPAISAPLLTLSKMHTPTSFIAGKEGVYTLKVGNAGSAPTGGSITLVDTLPDGLTLISARGKGWTFQVNGQTIIAMTNKSIAAGSQAPPISLRVRISSGTKANLINTAVVAGGSAVASVTTSDVTPVLIPPSPPASFRVKLIKNKFATQTEYVNDLKWKGDSLVSHYLLFRNNQLIATISHKGPFHYHDHNRYKQDAYEIIAVGFNGLRSPSVRALKN
jgi:uncharacterized repeat protein (TIGR01451 family)